MSIQKKYINKIDAINYPILPKGYRKYPTMNLDDAYEKGWTDLQEFLSNQMEENVAEVVQCKDCKYQDKGENDCEVWNLCRYRPWLHIPTEDDAFCSKGERKDG